MLIVLSLLLILGAGAVFAHDPSIEEEDWGSFDAPYAVADATISYALYGYLDENDIDVFQLEFNKAGADLRVQLITPVCGEHYVSFYPDYIVVGPKADPQYTDLDLPFELPKDTGVVYASLPSRAQHPTDEQRTTFVEQFGGTEYYDGDQLDLSIPVAGIYDVVVFADQTGDYTLATGYKEEFNSPLAHMLTAVSQIRSGEWLHRNCTLPPSDPNSILEHHHDHEADSAG